MDVEDKIGSKFDEFGQNILDFGTKTFDTAADMSKKIYKSTVDTVHQLEHEVKEKGIVGATKELVEHGVDSLKKARLSLHAAIS